MRRRGDRQELGQPLNHAEDGGGEIQVQCLAAGRVSFSGEPEPSTLGNARTDYDARAWRPLSCAGADGGPATAAGATAACGSG